ncbi:MAG: hypothetical protein VX677_00720 [Candidatus Poribacteria bacterium]|nr:hypothetical protein [Candidatus Poribacteria bacterium]
MKKQFNLLFVIAFVLLAYIGCQNSEPEDKSEENPVRVSDTNIGIVGTWQLVDYEPHDFEELPEMILVTKMDFSWSVTTIIQSVAFGELIVRATGNYKVDGNRVTGETIEASVSTGKVETEIPTMGTEIFRGGSVVQIQDNHLIIVYDDGSIARYKKTG